MHSSLIIRYSLALSLMLTSSALKADTISHIVMVWLKPEVTEAQMQEIIAATEVLKEIPGISDLRIGTAVASDRDIVDDSFSFGITMNMTGPEMMDFYLKHPIHVKYIDTYIKGKAEKLLIYDF